MISDIERLSIFLDLEKEFKDKATIFEVEYRPKDDSAEQELCATFVPLADPNQNLSARIGARLRELSKDDQAVVEAIGINDTIEGF